MLSPERYSLFKENKNEKVLCATYHMRRNRFSDMLIYKSVYELNDLLNAGVLRAKTTI